MVSQLPTNDNCSRCELHDVTIGVPTYKRPEMLEEALQSLVSQTQVPRIIVHDNCEMGSAAAVCQKFPQVHYRKNHQNLGAMGNFISLARACNTKYFGWLQDDDVLFPNYVEEVRRCLAMRQEISCVLAYALHTRRLDRVDRLSTPLYGPPGSANWVAGTPEFLPPGSILPWCLVRSVGFSPVAMFQRKRLLQALLETEHSDFGIFSERAIISSLSVCGTFGVIPKILGIWRRHDLSASNDFLREAQSDGAANYRRTLKNLEDFIDSKSFSVDLDVLERFCRELEREQVEDVTAFYSTSMNFQTDLGKRVFQICRNVLGLMSALPKEPPPITTAMMIKKRTRLLAWEVLPPFVAKMIQRVVRSK